MENAHYPTHLSRLNFHGAKFTHTRTHTGDCKVAKRIVVFSTLPQTLLVQAFQSEAIDMIVVVYTRALIIPPTQPNCSP